MGVGIRTRDLRKVYTSPPPIAARGAASGGGFSRKKKDSKASAHVTALDGVSLEVAPGEVFGLLGPNGAGKTTTVGVLTTRVRPTSGTGTVHGVDVTTDAKRARQLLAVVPQRNNLDRSLNIRQNLLFHAAYHGVGRAERNRRADEILERMGLTAQADARVDFVSGGQMQR